MRRLLLFAVLLLLPAVHALTITDIAISPANATTTATLSCYVTVEGEGTLSAAITWYRNGVAHGTDNETISLTNSTQGSTSVLGNIEAADTTKGQVWHCQATASNTTDTAAANSSTVTIRNTPPVVVSPVSVQNATEDSTFNQIASTTDSDGDTILTYISSDLNASSYGGSSLFTIATNGTISFTPTQELVGNHTMAILAYDGEEFGGVNVLYHIIEINDEPVFSTSVSAQNTTVGSPWSLLLTGVDEENDALNFSFTSNNTNLTLTSLSSTSANLSFATGNSSSADIGVWTVTVTVYETANTSSNTSITFLLTVEQPNRAPVLTAIANQTGTQGDVFTVIVNATDEDVGDQLLFSISSTCGVNPWSISTLDNMSAAAGGMVNLTLNNSHVLCPSVTVMVYDYLDGIARGTNDTQIVYFNITNTNDAPTVQNTSLNGSNTRNQYNLSNLSAAVSTAFFYAVNATDPDMLTYAGDTLTFTDNTTLFDINATTGYINFTPLLASIGQHTVLITVTDSNGSNATGLLVLTIETNMPPLLASVADILCQEDVLCAMNFTATDSDANENLTFITNSSLITPTWSTANTSIFDATYTNSEVGNYSILLTVTDVYGHTNTTTFTLRINNTNDNPFFDNTGDGIEDALSMPIPVVAGHTTSWLLNATDVDALHQLENITFSANITNGTNLALFTLEQINGTRARIEFTPSVSDLGNYSVNLTLTDLHGGNTTKNITFTIVNASVAPIITGVQPYSNGTLQTNSTITVTSATITNVTFAENTTAVFNLTFTDGDTASSAISVRYYIDGVLVHSTTGTNPLNYTKYFDFFSEGTYAVTAVVEDSLLSQDNFTWNVTITNVNRAPLLISNFQNRTINQTTILNDEMIHFIDPDDDLNSDNDLDTNETNTLTFTLPSSPYLSASFSDVDVTLTPLADGVATFNYNATDAEGLVLSSNDVTYTVLFTDEDSGSSSSSSGGGGGGGGGGAVIPKRTPVPDPFTIEIITPRPITIYDNNTVTAPLEIRNTGDFLLSGITLTARSDADVQLSFSQTEIAQLQKGESANVSLFINGFRYEGTYEVYITATVRSPSVNDSAVLYINSLEKAGAGEAVNVRVTSARDLLAAHPACGELVQLVNQAEQAYKIGDSETANELLDAVSNGCTFLQSKSAEEEIQTPGFVRALLGYQYINAVLGVLLLLLVISGVLLVVHYGKQQ
jgi:hypothetical protein